MNTPESKKKELTLSTWLNPAIKVGGLFRLISVTAPHLDGVYKVAIISYSGDSDGNDWMQTVTATIAENYKVPK